MAVATKLGQFNSRASAVAARPAQIEVTFDIDANGILHVSARDKQTGKENKITIKANSGLSEAEIDRMVKDAEANKAEDHRRFEMAQSRNALDALVHSVKKSVAEHGDKGGDDEKARIQSALNDAETLLKQAARQEALDEKASAASGGAEAREAIYAKAQQGPRGAGRRYR